MGVATQYFAGFCYVHEHGCKRASFVVHVAANYFLGPIKYSLRKVCGTRDSVPLKHPWGTPSLVIQPFMF